MPSFDGTGFKPKNKERRQAAYVKIKKSRESAKRDFRLKRRREEDRNPELRAARQAKNKPQTIDRKRVWDDVDGGTEGDGLGLSVDIASLKKRRLDHEALPGGGVDEEKEGLTEDKLKLVEVQAADENEEAGGTAQSLKGKQKALLPSASRPVDEDAENEEDQDQEVEALSENADDDLASILNESDSEDLDNSFEGAKRKPSPPASTTSTALTLIPDALSSKFPSLFKQPSSLPKILITTSFSSSIHKEAESLTTLIPNSVYIPRQRHRYKSHHFSLREIAKFATNRNFTSLLVMEEDEKRPAGLTAIHLPSGPTFHFSLKNWIPGRALPGHGNPTEHDPELILNGFRTPLGLLTAHLLKSLFPPAPELGGRQVVTLHNQRDYIFVRRHRYVFRDKRETEKMVTDADGAPLKGVEDIKAGLQELGPRFTLKLRRIDKGIQRASGQEWTWKARMEKERTKFQL